MGVWKFIKVTTKGGWYKKLLSSLVGWGKKIYRPEGPIFRPKQRFFTLRDMIRGKFSILTRSVKEKLLSSVEWEWARKFIGSTTGVVSEYAMQYKKWIYKFVRVRWFESHIRRFFSKFVNGKSTLITCFIYFITRFWWFFRVFFCLLPVTKVHIPPYFYFLCLTRHFTYFLNISDKFLLGDGNLDLRWEFTPQFFQRFWDSPIIFLYIF